MNAPLTNLQSSPQGRHNPSVALLRVLDRLPHDRRASFTDEQLAALDGALDANTTGRHAINFRVTLFGLVYLVVLGGRERRTRERRMTERQRHPLHSPGNVAFLVGLTIAGLIVGSSIRTMVTGG